MSEKRTPTPIAEWIYPIITDGVARYPNCQEREDNDESACALSAKVRWRGRDLCRRHASTLALIEAVSGRDTNATLTIDNSTLRAANEGLRDSYLQQVRVNTALVAALERGLEENALNCNFYPQADDAAVCCCGKARAYHWKFDARAALKVQP